MNRAHAAILIAVTVVVAVLPWVDDGKYAELQAHIGTYALIALGLGLLMGYAGQVSLGHAGFFAIGAYMSAALTTRLGASPWLALGAGAVGAAAVAAVVGIPTLRLKGHYLAMATLGFGEIVHVILMADPGGLTGAFDGLPRVGDPRIPKLLPKSLASALGGGMTGWDRAHAYVAWLFVLLAAVFAINLIRSRVGRALRSLHDSEVAAQATGVNTARTKLQVFIVSAVFASIAGSLHAHFVGQVAPSSFDLMWSIKFVMAVVLGGMASIWGPVAGTVILGSMRDVLEDWFHLSPDLDVLLFGLLVLLMMLFAPRGLGPTTTALLRRLVRRVARVRRAPA